MKKVTTSIVITVMAFLTSCGMSEEDKNKIIEEATTIRANQFCESNETMMTPLENYGKFMDYLTEHLTTDGVTDRVDISRAIDIYDKKIKESCPDKHPDNIKKAAEADSESGDTTLTEYQQTVLDSINAKTK